MDKQTPPPERRQFAHPKDVTHTDRLAKIKAFMKKRPPKKRLAIVAGVSLAVLISGSIAAFTLIKDNSVITPVFIAEKPPVEPVEKFYSALTGVETSEILSKKVVTAVMIENSVDARPQAGLQEAGVVFEAIAEGGITRFMALYQEAQPERIGPVRSARPYYVEWAAGFDAAYARSGGSDAAVALIQKLNLKDLDHGKYPNSYERVRNRFAPHNVYTDMKRLNALNIERGFTESSFTAFLRTIEDKEDKEPKKVVTVESIRQTEEPSATKSATKISFDISSPLYNTSYSYDATSKTYNRTLASRKHVDEVSGKQISPSVVIALFTDYSIHPNGIHSIYRTTGKGEAQIFQNGIVIEATWLKESQTAPLQFLDKNDKPIELISGQTWITAIQQGRVDYSAS